MLLSVELVDVGVRGFVINGYSHCTELMLDGFEGFATEGLL